MKQLKKFFKDQPYISMAFIVATVGTVGSILFSEYWQLVPCKLCWWQRIFMYPIPFIMAVGLWRQDKRIYQYILPLSLIGITIAIYHNIMYYLANYMYGVNDTIFTACSGGVSCTNVQLEWLGFISIPLLSLAGFAFINILMYLDYKHSKGQNFLGKFFNF